jgi:hypothetical protein
MKQKLVLLTGIGIVLAVAVTMMFYVSAMSSMNLQEYLMIFVIFIIVLAAAWLIKDRLGNMRKDLPVKDERQTGIAYRAGYYSWIASIWSAIGIMWIGIFLEEELGYASLTANWVVAGVVLISALVFFGSYFYLNRRGG